MVYRSVKIVIFLIVCIVRSTLLSAQHSETYIVIVNESVNNLIKKKELNSYLRGEKNFWPGGSEVIISLPSPKSELAENVAQSVFKTNVTGMQKYWLSLVFQGRVDPPTFLRTDEETISFVRTNKGAIGIIQTKSQSIAAELIIRYKDQSQ